MSAMGYFRRFDAIRFYVGYHSDRDVTLKKKSQYLADRAGYCDFAFCYMCLFENNH